MKGAFCLSLALLLAALYKTALAGKPESCLVKGYNEELNVDDVFEVDMDLDEIEALRKDYEKDVLPYLETGTSGAYFSRLGVSKSTSIQLCIIKTSFLTSNPLVVHRQEH